MVAYSLQDSLAEVEEKYKKAMVSNAQLDNEKTNFMYQVDTLKDALLELEEQLAESRRQYEEKSKVSIIAVACYPTERFSEGARVLWEEATKMLLKILTKLLF